MSTEHPDSKKETHSIETHSNSINTGNTTDKERADYLANYLEAIEEVCSDPQLMPLGEEGKSPAIEEKCNLGSEEAEEMLLTSEQAIRAIREEGVNGFALYAGRQEHGTENLVFADHDDLDKFPLDTLPETLTVVSGSGKGYHETFVNGDDVQNSQGKGEMKGAGEIRASNWYVILPGSIHPSGGIYHLDQNHPIVELTANDIPEGLQPSTTNYSDDTDFEIPQESTDGDFTNELGMSLDEVRDCDDKLDELLETRPRPNSDRQDDSEIDAKLVRRLRYHHFDHSDIIAIWRQYRGRSKLKRNDYVQKTIHFAGTHNDRCRYDGTEHSLILPEPPTSDWESQYTSEDEEPALTLSEARERCQERISKALQNHEHTLIAALPAMGKSRGLVKEAANTGVPLTVLTSRHDLYSQYCDWCEEDELSYQQLPSFHHDCPTARGDHGEDWQEKVQSAYKKGFRASEIHKYDEELFDEPLPCEETQECSYKQKWDFESSDYEVLIGHYQHAYNPNIVEDRVVAFDEFPEDAFIQSFEGDTVGKSVSAYLSDETEIPVRDYSDLLEHRESLRIAAVRGSLEKKGLERDEETVLEALQKDSHTDSRLLLDALIEGEDLDNGWEHATLDDGSLSVPIKAARDRSTGEIFLLRPPCLKEAKGVIGLDGTPTHGLWKMAVDSQLSYEQILSDEERGSYLTDALNLSIVQTTDSVKPYSSGNYVNSETDSLLFEAVAEQEGTDPALISTAKALTQYKQSDVFDPIGESKHYGDLKGSNDLQDEHVGIVVGSRHYGDDYVKRWGALRGNAIERVGREKFPYSTEFGGKVLRHMREHELLQAVLRFGRNASDTRVYVHTNALPEWVPIEEKVEVKKMSKGMLEIVSMLKQEAPGEWRTTDIAENVSICPRQVRSNLNQLTEMNYIEKKGVGRGRRWIVEDEALNQLERVHFRSS